MFTLAHISDIHLAPVPWPSLSELDPKRALGLANWHRKRKQQHRREVLDALVADMMAQYPSHIAIGGDLVNAGLPGELDAARLWLTSLGPPADVTVVPGNHDVYGRSGLDPGIERWRDYMRGEAGAADAGFPFVRRFGRIALIALSSAVPTPVFWASGRLGPAQLQALAGLLQDLGAQGCCRIVLLHHPPLPGQADRRRGLEDARELAEILAWHGAELVLHGHNHQATVRWLERPARRIPVIGVPSASATPGAHTPAARYHMFAIEPAAAGWRIGLTGRGFQPDGRIAEVDCARLAG